MGPTDLKYVLLARYASNNNLLYCDPDMFPLQVMPEEEQRRAEAKLPEIIADKEKYEAILRHNNLVSAVVLTAEQKLLVYRESKKLDRVELTPAGDKYKFSISAANEPNVSEGAGTKHQGVMGRDGNVSDETQEPVSVSCPICLAGDTLISTPGGPVRVRDMQEGMPVWTLDKGGSRVTGTVVRTIKREVASPHEMLHLVLSDGRELYVAPRHPLTDGTPAGNLQADSMVDGVHVERAERVPYNEGATYDILPSGETGFYWANGVPLASTLRTTPPGRR
jgi:hypothetical protein